MFLSDLLPKLSKNPELKIRIVNDDGTDIVTFNAAGYPAVNDELNAREVDKVLLTEYSNLLKVLLQPIPTPPEPEPEPEPTPDDPEPSP